METIDLFLISALSGAFGAACMLILLLILTFRRPRRDCLRSERGQQSPALATTGDDAMARLQFHRMLAARSPHLVTRTSDGRDAVEMAVLEAVRVAAQR
jgi:hypothetical protein